MRAALVLSPRFDHLYPAYSLGLLSAILKRRGHESAVFDLNKEFFLYDTERTGPLHPASDILAHDEFWHDPGFIRALIFDRHRAFFDRAIDRLLNCGARVIGFSVYHCNHLVAAELARRIKRRDPGVVVLFGGPSCFKPEECRRLLRLAPVDAVVLGEGEETLPAVLDALSSNRPLESVPGVLTAGNSSADAKRPQTTIRHEDLPAPDFSGFDLAKYPNGELTLETSRGCVRQCAFCNDWRQWKKFRQKDCTRTLDQIEFLLKAHPETRGFLFSDSIFNADMKQLDGLADGLLRREIRTKWSGFAISRPEMNLSVMEKLKASGCWNLFVGVESGSDKVLRDMKKCVSSEINAGVLKASRAAGITNATLIVVGYPSETEEDFQLTVDFIRDNAEAIGCLSITICDVDDMVDDPAAYGIRPPRFGNLFWESSDGENTLPVRVERFRRLAAAARAAGVDVHVMRRNDEKSVFYYTEELLAMNFRARGELARAESHAHAAQSVLRDWQNQYRLAHAAKL
jgi:hypothetical protein